MSPSPERSQRICILGAGPSGLAMARRLLEAGFTRLSLYDRQSSLGGNWTWNDAAKHSSLYDTVRSISSRDMTAFPGVPFSPGVGHYPTRTEMLHYLRLFGTRFGLERYISFGREVTRVSPAAEGGWTVAWRDGAQHFDAVCVCSGHHWRPIFPELPGDFSGKLTHAHEYGDGTRFSGQRALVIGCGNSGADIAVDLARRGCAVTLSVRRGYHIVPRLLLGMPSDVVYSRLRRYVPEPLLRPLAQLLLTVHRRALVGGAMPKPDHALFETHPLVNSELLPVIRRGQVKVVGPVQETRGERVFFAPVSQERRKASTSSTFDHVIACTGYEPVYPFLDSEIVGEGTAGLLGKLSLRLVHRHYAGLYFLGLLQPSGSLWPVVDAQARYVAAHLAGSVQVPPAALEEGWHKKRYVASSRHLLEVNGEDYESMLLARLRQAETAAREVHE